MTQVRSNGAQLAELAGTLDDGTVRIALDSTFGLAEARAAHERAEQGHLRGKIALSVVGQARAIVPEPVGQRIP